MLSAAYADVTKTLSIDVAMSPEELTAFYVKAMAKAGWKPTTEKLVKIDFDQLMIFRNAAKDLATLQMQTIDGKLRATLKHETAAEFEEGLRLAKEEDAKRKTELARQKEMTGKAAEKGVEPVAIAVPSGAKQVERTRNGLEFKLPSGTAKAAVETIREDLIKHGWKANPGRLDAVAGSLVLKKNADSLVTIVYTDTGVNDAEFSITLINAKLEATEVK